MLMIRFGRRSSRAIVVTSTHRSRHHSATQAMIAASSPDTLGMPTYADIASYLFKSNGSPAGKTELPADRAKLRDILVTSR